MIDFSGNANLFATTGKSNQVDTSDLKARGKRLRFVQAQGKLIKSLREVAGELPAPGEQLRLVTLENFNAFTFVPFLIGERGRIDHLTAAMYSISQEVTLTLCEMLKTGAVGRIDLLISETINFRFPARIKELVEQANLRRDTFRVGVGRNHAKVALMACGEDRYVVEGSGNWCHNARIEQYVFDNSAEVYAFHDAWIRMILEESGEVQPGAHPRGHKRQRGH
jgi:hypothetical protein